MKDGVAFTPTDTSGTGGRTWRVERASDLVWVDRNDAPRGRYHIPSWGPWVLHRRDRELVHTRRGYGIDLDDCRDSARVLDWICQIAMKLWADDACLAGLARALDDILQLQGNMCGGGRNQDMSRADIRSRIRQPSIAPRLEYPQE